MSKLYIGNLPQDATEAALRQLLEDSSVVCGAILVKRGGYAFVDCPDQSAADKAIDKLNGECWSARRCGAEYDAALLAASGRAAVIWCLSGHAFTSVTATTKYEYTHTPADRLFG